MQYIYTTSIITAYFCKGTYMLLKYLKTTENLRKLNCQFVSHDIEKWRADIGIMHIHVHINRGDEIKKQ